MVRSELLFNQIWSRKGANRFEITQCDYPVYSISFSYDENFSLHPEDKNLVIKSINRSGGKNISWKAHDQVILCTDWNVSNKLIISGAEDNCYKIWDQYGRSLYSSLPYSYVITSLAWAPSGEYFAVGSFESIRLCNQTGWTYSLSKIDSGSMMKLKWSGDGTTVAGATVYF